MARIAGCNAAFLPVNRAEAYPASFPRFPFFLRYAEKLLLAISKPAHQEQGYTTVLTSKWPFYLLQL